MRISSIVAVALLLAGFTLRSPAQQITPGAVWLDDRGQEIQAHGGGILQWNSTYYWFGEDRSQSNDPNKRYVACYSSQDLVHWKYHRQVVAWDDVAHLGEHWILERPKVFHNSRTHKFVMYAHIDDAPYKYARVAVATSDTVDGDYHYVKSFRPLDQESRDIGQFVDDDGAAYLIFESRPTGGFYIAKLSDDYMSVTESTAFLHEALEGGALVHVGGRYYVIGSHLSGWAPNPNVFATATKLSGPWTPFENIAPPDMKTYGSQSSMLLKVQGKSTTSVIFMGDVWKPKELWDSRYLWMPLNLKNGSMQLPAPCTWSLSLASGEAHCINPLSN